MIKDASLAAGLLNSFPAVTKDDKAQIFEMLPHYIFYKSLDKKRKECICTHCKKKYVVTDKSRKAVLADIKHNAEGVCPKCGRDITYKSYSRGRNRMEGWDKVCIMHAVGQDLFMRCFYLDWKYDNDKAEFDLNERHRYYAGENGANHWERRYLFSAAEFNPGWQRKWVSLKTEHEPVFGSALGHPDINEYWILNPDEWKKTCLRYCQFDMYKEAYGNHRPIEYLCLAANHPNVEYVMKVGFGRLIVQSLDYRRSMRINWRSNDVKKMLGLSKAEMQLKPLKGDLKTYLNYKIVRKWMPKENIDFLLASVCKYGDYFDKAQRIHGLTGLPYKKIFHYAEVQREIRGYGTPFLLDWLDYLEECRQLGYDLTDTAVSKPKDLATAHMRTSKIIGDLKEIEQQKAEKEKADGYAKKMKKRLEELQPLSYTSEDLGLQIIIPKDYMDIVNEGKMLSHCVGGYADRHASGALNILFVRQINAPEKPYYTMEVSKTGKIVQCRGYKNNWADNPKPEAVKEFEERYARHLQKVFAKKKVKKPAKQSAAAPAA